MEKVKYDATKRSKAGTAAALRIVVSVYIAYLAYKIAFAENTSMSLWQCRLFGAFFFLAAVAFAVYSIICYRNELKAAVINSEETDSISVETGTEVSEQLVQEGDKA